MKIIKWFILCTLKTHSTNLSVGSIVGTPFGLGKISGGAVQVDLLYDFDKQRITHFPSYQKGDRVNVTIPIERLW